MLGDFVILCTTDFRLLTHGLMINLGFFLCLSFNFAKLYGIGVAPFTLQCLELGVYLWHLNFYGLMNSHYLKFLIIFFSGFCAFTHTAPSVMNILKRIGWFKLMGYLPLHLTDMGWNLFRSFLFMEYSSLHLHDIVCPLSLAFIMSC